MSYYRIVCNKCGYEWAEDEDLFELDKRCQECASRDIDSFELVEKQDWVNYPHNLPKEGDYMCRAERWGEKFFVALTFKEGSWFNLAQVMSLELTFQGTVTHYQPLPESPKGDL